MGESGDSHTDGDVPEPKGPPSLAQTEHALAEQMGPQAEVADAARLKQLVQARLFGGAHQTGDPSGGSTGDASRPEFPKIGRYTILRRLGSGGMGVVYAAYDDSLDRRVAIKLLKSESEEQQGRLKREAQALARLSHQNVVQVYEVGEFEGQVFLAMEFVRGSTLGDWKPDASVREVLQVFIAAGRGLAHAHAAGLVHRDFKPDNVLVGEDDRPRVLDFGLARSTGERDETNAELEGSDIMTLSSRSGDSLSRDLTRTGAIMGTPAYMSPEQFHGKPLDARTDQFSFCVALWERLYGARPFSAQSIRDLAYAVTTGNLSEPSGGRNVPAWIRRVLTKGLSVKPTDRYPSMDTLLVALSRDRRRTRRLVAAGIGLVAIATSIGIATQQGGEPPEVCTGARDELVGVWDEDVRGQMRDVFLASGAPSAQEAFESTASRLDVFADGWVAIHTRTCEAGLTDADSDRIGSQMLCLGQRKREFNELTRILTDPAVDADTVRRAVFAATDLREPETCEDEAMLRGLSPPESEAQREEYEAIDRLLAQARSKLSLGLHSEGLQTAQAAVERADALENPRYQARALSLLGKLQQELKDVEAAEKSLRSALRLADSSRDDATRAETLVHLVRVVGLDQARIDEGREIAADARAAIERLGGQRRLEMALEVNLGSVAKTAGDFDEAIEHHKAALAIANEILGQDSPQAAIALNNMGNAMIAQGRLTQAEATLRRAQKIFEETFGPDNPLVAIVISNIGSILIERGRQSDDPETSDRDFAEAERLFRRAIQIREANFGGDHPVVSKVVHNLGEALLRQASLREALAQFERALDLKRPAYGDEHPTVAMTLAGIGRTRIEMGELDAARGPLEEALAIRESRGEKTAPEDLGETLFALARTQPESEGAKARSQAERAVKAYEEAGELYVRELEQVRRFIDALPPADPKADKTKPDSH